MLADPRHRSGYAVAFAIFTKVAVFPLGIVLATLTLLVFACVGVVHVVRLIGWKVLGGARPVLLRPEPDEPAT